MRAAQIALTSLAALSLLAASMIARDSVALPDGGAPPVIIPPWVEETKLPAFDAEPFPAEKSKAPRQGEWKDAPRVRLTRVAKGATGCRASRIREWIKIHCDRKTAGLRLVAGSTEGIALWVADSLPSAPNPVFSAGLFSEIDFPVRPDDRRVFELLDEAGGYDGFGATSALLIEEQWRAGAPKPEIALLAR
jgi:hypothetical protein